MKILKWLLLISMGILSISSQAKTENGKVYRVMADPYLPPFIFRDTQNNIAGFDFDILKAIAAQQGFSVTFKLHSWEGLFDTLQNDESDIVTSGVTITNERRKIMDFSNPYFESKQLLLFNPAKVDLKLPEQIINLKVALQNDTTSDELIKKKGNIDKVEYVKTIYGAVKKMLLGYADAALGDSGTMLYYKKKYSDVGLKSMTDTTWPIEDYGFAVRKGNIELLNKLNQGLKAIKNNGIYHKIYQKWFSE